ncbi:MAG: potassium channel protein [Saprospiraceae bacterium]|nr:potassium channel protein [Saprospiraceae bacterium]
MKNFVIAISLLSLSLAVGILGYMLIEGYDLLNAFYMAVITISTVGFTEVFELSPNGRLFTAGYIMVNLGIFAYVISVLTTFLVEGKLRSVFKNFMSDREISRLNNHVIVCGYGRNGSQACEELIREGREFVVIEKNPEMRQSVTSELNFQMIIADAAVDDNLKRAGIERAGEIIITTPSDAANVFITLTARELKPDITIIARASQKDTESKLYRAGADRVILPDILGGMFMAQMVTKPVVIEFLDLLTGRGRNEKYKLESIHFEDLKQKYRDKTLQELDIKNLTGGTVVAVKDNIKGMIPNPPAETFIGVDDTMIILCSEDTAKEVVATLTR